VSEGRRFWGQFGVFFGLLTEWCLRGFPRSWCRAQATASSVGSRALEVVGGSEGLPRWRRDLRASALSLTTARSRSRPWQLGQSRTTIS